MSFTYGGTDTRGLAGVTATLSEWPSLGGLSVEALDVPGRDGRFFTGQSRSRTRFVFDVAIQGASPSEVAQRRDNFVGMLDPSRGPRELVVEAEAGWVWSDVLPAEEIDWSRGMWEHGYCVLRGEVVFETVGDPSAREASPAAYARTAPFDFTLASGNTSSYPRIRFDAASAASDADFVVRIGGFAVTVTSGFPAGHMAELDYERFEFYELNSSGARVASLVPRMSHFERPELQQGQTVRISVSPSVPFTFHPNARRI